MSMGTKSYSQMQKPCLYTSLQANPNRKEMSNLDLVTTGWECLCRGMRLRRNEMGNGGRAECRSLCTREE